MNLVKSANERAKEAAIQKQQEAQFKRHVESEHVNIRITLLQVNPKLAQLAWASMSALSYPETTYYAQAYYALLKGADDMPHDDKVIELVEFIKNGK